MLTYLNIFAMYLAWIIVNTSRYFNYKRSFSLSKWGFILGWRKLHVNIRLITLPFTGVFSKFWMWFLNLINTVIVFVFKFKEHKSAGIISREGNALKILLLQYMHCLSSRSILNYCELLIKTSTFPHTFEYDHSSFYQAIKPYTWVKLILWLLEIYNVNYSYFLYS